MRSHPGEGHHGVPGLPGRLRLWCASLAVAATSTACEAPMLVHTGYAAPNKVWYHWQHSMHKHTLIVCDVAPDGSETNCRESDI
jgi:hypothetical protein